MEPLAKVRSIIHARLTDKNETFVLNAPEFNDAVESNESNRSFEDLLSSIASKKVETPIVSTKDPIDLLLGKTLKFYFRRPNKKLNYYSYFRCVL